MRNVFGRNLFSCSIILQRLSLGNTVKMSSKSSKSQSYDFEYTEHYDCIKKVEQFIPKLNLDLSKGNCGRIGVIGGSVEYTGAPYFAAISALKTGADLVYVFCCREAAPVIKSYSPELIVYPVLDNKEVAKKIAFVLDKLHVLLIGPGLGRDPNIMKNVGSIITHCKEKITHCPPLIFDADGLYLVSGSLELVKNYRAPIIFTPNQNEFNKLLKVLDASDALEIGSTLNAVVVQKGKSDVITNGIYQKQLNLSRSYVTLICDMSGSNRRCGGQGDILAGSLATFIAWFRIHIEANEDNEEIEDLMSFNFNDEQSVKEKNFEERFMGYSFAAYGACSLIRSCSRFAYDDYGRGMTASDMIPHISKAFKLHFGV